MSRTFINANGKELKFTNIEALNEISKSVYIDDEVVNQCFVQIRTTLERLEQAMELIDKKQVAWGLIIRCQSAEEYNKWTHDYHITQEEYDFLRTFVHKESEEK